MLEIIIGSIIGGVFAIAGGFVASWYQAKNARRIRTSEILAEKEVEARRRAHNEIIRLRSELLQCDNKEVLQRMDSDISWIVDLRPYLPPVFYDNWMSIRACLRKIPRRTDTTKWEEHCEKLADKALEELERVMNLKPKELKYPPESE